MYRKLQNIDERNQTRTNPIMFDNMDEPIGH